MARMLRCEACPPGDVTRFPYTEAGTADAERHQRDVHGAPAEPVPVTVTRWLCPFCRRGRSTRKAAAVHVGKCFRNPAARACQTCAHFTAGEPGDYQSPGCPDNCAESIDISSELRTGCPLWALRKDRA